MYTLLEEREAEPVMTLTATLEVATQTPQPRQLGSQEDFVYEDEQEKHEVAELKAKLKPMKIVARAKVTKERVYSAAYHPEITKDLIFFGGKYAKPNALPTFT
jgi:WD repeat-containing protein 76